MSDSFLLDTNIVSALFSADAEVVARVQDTTALFVSTLTLGVLLYGAYYSPRVEQTRERARASLAEFEILDCDRTMSDSWGRITADLRRKGQLIPDNDIRIAATAEQHGLTLVTRVAHFRSVEGLTTAQW